MLNKFIWTASKLSIATLIAVGSMLSVGSFAQDSEYVEEVITLGSRAKARSATDSVAPVDVINASELANQGDVDITNLLRNSVPSFYVSDQPISDAGTMVRPQGLRGMSADHTLVLVNGKRRHRSSVILWAAGGISDGAQGPDTSVFPTAAIKNIEVLRDGAASQYGSDALAGVINFNLKDASEGGSISFKAGEYGEGDGDMQYFSGNFGLPLGTNGFVNTTFEMGSLGDTNRAVQRADAAGLVADGYTNVPNPAMIWGRPKVDDDKKLFINFGADLGNNTEMYGYANSTTKKIDGGFYFRNPTNRGGVYGNGSTLLIGDMDGIGVGTDCPVVTLDGNTPDPVAMAIVAADPNCFSFQETIPGGFTPRFGGTMTDQAMLFGLRGEMANGVGWDVSSYYGKNEADFFINNTVNASMGPNSPRDFDPGLYRQVETSLNADFTYAMSDAVSLAFGAEYRNEEFTIGAGDSASSTAGVLANQGFSLSSNGFPGFAKAISGVFDRSNTAVYVEADWQASDDLVVVGALRFEDFDDFGTTTNYKLGANYSITDTTGVRGTFSTGFKAPTPGQSNASNISTTIDNATGKLVNKGVIPATSPVALVYGGKQLQPEDSENMTFGIYTTVGEFEITLDYFSIDVDDRLNFSKDVNLSAADIAQLIADNVPGAGDMSKFRFYTNDFDTTTDGFDLVVSTSTDWMGGTTDWNLAYNQTNTDVTNRGVTIDDEREKRIEQMTPDTRWNLSANHMMGDWRMLARISYYDDWYDSGEGFVYPGENVVDLELAYNINDNSSILVGINNVLDEAGDTLHNINSYGNLYSTQAPMGFSGEFWYAKYSYNF